MLNCTGAPLPWARHPQAPPQLQAASQEGDVIPRTQPRSESTGSCHQVVHLAAKTSLMIENFSLISFICYLRFFAIAFAWCKRAFRPLHWKSSTFYRPLTKLWERNVFTPVHLSTSEVGSASPGGGGRGGRYWSRRYAFYSNVFFFMNFPLFKARHKKLTNGSVFKGFASFQEQQCS